MSKELEVRQLSEQYSTEELKDFIPKLLDLFCVIKNEIIKADLNFAVGIMKKIINEREAVI